MAKRPSMKLETVRAVAGQPADALEREERKRKGGQPSRAGKVPIVSWVDPDFRREVKLAAVSRDTTVEALIVEGLMLIMPDKKSV